MFPGNLRSLFKNNRSLLLLECLLKELRVKKKERERMTLPIKKVENFLSGYKDIQLNS